MTTQHDFSHSFRALANNTLMNIKLTFRDRQAIFWIFVFPLFFLFLFATIFARSRPEIVGSMLPGLLTINSMSSGLFGLSITLVIARERGILRRYRLTPISPWMILMSRSLSSLLVGILTLSFQLVLAKLVYGITIAGGLLSLYAVLIAGALAFIALGFIIASVADNVKIAQVMANLTFFPLMFLGGAAIPMQFLPPKLQGFAHLLPPSYMVDGLLRIMKDGQGLSPNLRNLGALLIIFVVSLLIAAKLFRWESREPLPLKQKAWAAAVIVVFLGVGLLMNP